MFNILNNSNMFHMAKKGHWATKLHPLSLCDATHAKNDFENCGRPSKMLDVLAYLFSRGAADYVGDARAVWNFHASSALPAFSILYFPNRQRRQRRRADTVVARVIAYEGDASYDYYQILPDGAAKWSTFQNRFPQHFLFFLNNC